MGETLSITLQLREFLSLENETVQLGSLVGRTKNLTTE